MSTIDEKTEKASLMLDIKAFFNEFKDYSPAMDEILTSRTKELEKAYAELHCAKKIVSCARMYVLKKYEEQCILNEFYSKIEVNFFDEVVESLCNGSAIPDPEAYHLPAGYSRFTAEALVPFMIEKLGN